MQVFGTLTIDEVRTGISRYPVVENDGTYVPSFLFPHTELAAHIGLVP